MNTYIRKTFSYILLLTIFITSSCETLDLDVEDNPNVLLTNQADIDFFLNSIQIGLANFISGFENNQSVGISRMGMEPVRMLHGSGPTYRTLYTPGNIDRVWNTAYATVLTDIRTMAPLAEQQGLYTHIAISQIIESYIMLTLVDYFGNVPYSEAILGSDNINPKLDSGESIYEAVDVLLLEAIDNLNKEESAEPKNDLYYNNDENKWIKLANTLRLKLYLQTRKANGSFFNETKSTNVINELIANDNLILSSEDDFQFQWSTNNSAPDSRHPYFAKNFGPGPNSNFYFSNYYMNLMVNKYTINDPRTRYYFYRQTEDFNNANVSTKTCVTQNRPPWYDITDVFCTVPGTDDMDGFWGRDHLDEDGTPPDSQFRTVFGVFPVGGPFDDDSFRNMTSATASSEGLSGAGITPILLASYTNFMLAEASLELGTSGNAKTYLETGISESITKTITFSNSVAANSSFIPNTQDIQTYTTAVLNDYDNNSLKVIVEQYFIAAWTNGIEVYNTYRRTGQPNDVTPALDVEDPGSFIRSHWYPSNAADRNSNIDQKNNLSTQVFWDTNPEGFVQ